MSRKRKNYRKKPSMQALMTLGMRDGSDVWLNYVDLNGTMTERVIKPIFVMEERVHAFCYEKRSARQFLFENVHSARVVQKSSPYREAVGRCSCGINTMFSVPHWIGLKGAGGRCDKCDKCDKPLLLKWCKKAR
jgi:hypothetical protein